MNATMQLPKVGRYEFLAEPFHCDLNDQLFVGHLGNHMLNAADYHSNDRGYGMHYLNTVHRTWVLSRLAIEMDHMPRSYDKFVVETWVEKVVHYFTSRNFAVTSPDGKLYGYARSVWAMIDTETRQPADILSVHDGLIGSYIEVDKTCPIAAASRVKMDSQKAVSRMDYVPVYADIDINGHVNSIKYIEHVLNLWPIDFLQSHSLKRMDMAYVREARAGERLTFLVDEVSPLISNVCIAKAESDGEEVCRARVEFRQK